MTRLLDHYVHTGRTAVELLDPRIDPSPAPLRPPAAGSDPEPLADRAAARTWQTAEYPVLLAAIRHTAAAGLDSYTCHLAWAVRLFLDRSGLWHDLSTVSDAVRQAGKRMNLPVVEGFALRMGARGHTRLGQHAEARHHLEQALDILTRVGDRAGMAHTHNDLNQICLRAGAYAQAVEHGTRALELFRSVGHRVGTAVALNGLGYSSARAGQPIAAQDYCRQAVAFFQQFGDIAGEASAWQASGTPITGPPSTPTPSPATGGRYNCRTRTVTGTVWLPC